MGEPWIPFKDLNELFSNNMFIDLNINLCHWGILCNYAWILNAKYEQVVTKKVAANQNQ